ncbi:MAG TPA: hypothetical protein VIS51_00530, partial [Solirubrobacterales bacterium]
AAALLTLALLAAPTASAQRGVPVGLYNVNNQVMNSSGYVYAIRFVIDQNTTIDRFISGFNLEGSDPLGGREGYADGNGGTIRARLVAVRPDGTPDMSQVLAEETVGAVQRYQESKQAYGAPGKTQLLYFNMGGVAVNGGQTYAMTYQNVDSSPASNWFSENSPTVKESVAGPNGVNTLDPNAPGAIAGLDPREAVAWSRDSGKSWVWGRRAGEGSTPGAYAGSASGDDGTRLPWYGWQTAPGAAPQSNQPYYAYTESGSYTLRLRSVPTSVTLTEAGGYAPVGSSAGVLTVRNLSTGATGRTASLGSGLVRGMLDNPVPVKAGQSYEISNTGRVLKAEGDSFIRSTFKIGTGSWAFETETLGQEDDRAQLFTAGAEGVTAAPVVVRRVTISIPSLGKSPAATRRAKRAGRLRFFGRVAGPARVGARVFIQIRDRRNWRKVGSTKVGVNGRIRFHRWTRLRTDGAKPRARAMVRGIGRSRPVRVAVRH